MPGSAAGSYEPHRGLIAMQHALSTWAHMQLLLLLLDLWLTLSTKGGDDYTVYTAVQ